MADASIYRITGSHDRVHSRFLSALKHGVEVHVDHR